MRSCGRPRESTLGTSLASTKSNLGLRIRGIATLALVFSGLAGSALAGEPTVLRTDTVWEGDICLSRDVTVAPNATLLVLPGTTIRVERHMGAEGRRGLILDIQGRLIAQGREARPIVFTSASESPAAGDWAGIVFTRTRARISRLSHCRIEFADAAIQGGVSEVVIEDSVFRRNRAGVAGFEGFRIRLTNCELSDNGKGLYFDRDVRGIVERCRILRNAEAGVEENHGAATIIRGCQIIDNGPVGIHCVSGASPKIEENVIRGHGKGVFVELMSSPEILHNQIVDNGTGLWAEKHVRPLVRRNLIARNNVGVYCNLAARPRIEGNDILDNRTFALVLGDNLSLAAEGTMPQPSQKREPRGGALLQREGPAVAAGPRAEAPFVNATGNWWGEAGAKELARLGPEGNACLFDDGWDKPTVEFLGPTGERTGQLFPRDKVAFFPFAERSVADANRVGKENSGLRGRVVTPAGEPVSGARVYVFRKEEKALQGEGLRFSSRTEVDGTYDVRLDPGRYRVIATRTDSPFPGAEPKPGDLVSTADRLVEIAEGAFMVADISLKTKEAP